MNIVTEMLQKRYLQEKETPVKIEVEHPGMLEVPEGKNVEDLPMSHFQDLVKKKSYESIARALTNLIVWNKTKNPTLSKWADNMQNNLKSWVDKERETNPDFG